MDLISKVKEFHQTFGHNINDRPTIVDQKEFDLRIRLIREELEELEEGIRNEDIVEIGDAFADILYVFFGTVLSFGLEKNISQCFGTYIEEITNTMLKEKPPYYVIDDSSIIDIYRILNIIEKAYTIKDLNKLIHSLSIILFNLEWVIVEMGYSQVIKDLFEEVHFSNMSKACKTEQEAYDTLNSYKEKGVNAYMEQKNNLFIIKRSSDNKILKNINYIPANIKKYLE